MGRPPWEDKLKKARMVDERNALYRDSPLLWSAQSATIVDPVRGRQRFSPWQYQAEYLMDRSPRKIALKARQVGFSNVIAIEAIHDALWRPDTTLLMVSRNQRLARNLITYCQHTLSGLRQIPKLKVENQGELAFENGSQIISLPANPSTGRGFAATKVFLDEFAFCNYDALIYESVIGTLSTGGSMTIASTPNGRSNMFYRIWAGREGGAWSKHMIHWKKCPRYWTGDEMTPTFAQIRSNMTLQSFAQEYDCDFVTSGVAVFREEDLDKLAVGYDPEKPIGGWDEIVTGWDIGRRQDATVGITLGRKGLIWHLIKFERHIGIPYPEIQRVIEERYAEFPYYTSIETNGIGDVVYENVNVPAKPFLVTPRTKTLAIQALQLMTQRQSLKLDEPAIIRELDMYQWDDKELVQDTVMALAQLAYYCENPQPMESLVEYDDPVSISPY